MIYTFGDYELDLDRYELRHAGQALSVEPKVFDALTYLIEDRGQAVSKEELLEHVWAGQFVSDSALTYCVMAARRAMGDSGRAQRLIKTIHGHGYRFIGEIDSHPSKAAEVPPTAVTSPVEAPMEPSPAPVEPPRPALVPMSPPLSAETAAAESAPLRPPPPREAERRQLTVLACRVVASSTLDESLDPEDLHEVMFSLQNVYREVIGHFEGHIAQYLSDGLVVYFGSPLAHEDDAQRAVRSGRAIMAELERLKTTLEWDKGITLSVRMGIDTGIVVMGPVGVDAGAGGDSTEPLALGETPQIATQLLALAESGTILTTEATYRLTEGYFSFEALGVHECDDRAQMLAVFQVMAENTAHNRFAVALQSGLTPLVGREQELSLIIQGWTQAQAGNGQAIVLSGEGGIGKSRLVQAFKDHLAAEACLCVTFEGSPYHSNRFLYPVVDTLQRHCGWHNEERPEAKFLRLEATLSAAGFDLKQTVPLLASLLSLPLPPRYPTLTLSSEDYKQRVYETLLTWHLKETEQHPVCIIVEDLHWVDPSTLEFLGLLIDQLPMSRLLLLSTCRPELQLPWPVRSHLTPIGLNRLDRAQVEALVTHRAGDIPLPTAIVEQIVDKTDGVPLFVEELTKMVIESGWLKEVDGRYELLVPLPSLTIPSTLQESLMARLDGLGPAKHTAQLAAVLGRTFPFALLQAVSPAPEETLRQELSQLVDAELLLQGGLPSQRHYQFKHAFIQDIAYQSLLRRTRQRHHQHIAQVLEASFADIRDQQPELLAHHYTEAGSPESAIPYWQQAGQHAREQSALAEAISHFEQARGLLTRLPETPDRMQRELTLQTALGVMYMTTQGSAAPDAESAYLRALELGEQLGDMTQRFTVLRGLYMSSFMRGELQAAKQLGEQILHHAQDQHDAGQSLEAHRILGTSLCFLGELETAWTHLEQGLSRFDPQQRHGLTIHYGQDTEVVCLSYRAWNLWLRGYPDQSLETIDAAVALGQQLAHPYSLIFALTLNAVLCQWRGDIEGMQTRAEAVVDLANEHAFPLFKALGETYLGWVRAAQGYGAAGIDQIRQGITAVQATGTNLTHPFMVALLAQAHRIAGKLDDGLRLLTDVLSSAPQTEERWYEAELYRLQGEFTLDRDASALAEAEACFEQALIIARQQRAKSWELRTTLSLSRLWRSQGRRDEARQCLASVLETFTEGFDTTDLREAQAWLDALQG